MVSEDTELQGMAAAVIVPDWLRGLIRAVRHDGLQPKDARVKSLWDLLRQRQLLNRSMWLQAMLRFVWGRGLRARPRPRTTRRLVRLLRRWGILPPRLARPVGTGPTPTRPSAPVIVRPVRPLAVRPLQPVSVQPLARVSPRR